MLFRSLDPDLDPDLDLDLDPDLDLDLDLELELDGRRRRRWAIRGFAGHVPGRAGHAACTRRAGRRSVGAFVVRASPLAHPFCMAGSLDGAKGAPYAKRNRCVDCYRLARELAAHVHRAGIADAELRDQATRASKSALLNLCEGLPGHRPSLRIKYSAARTTRSTRPWARRPRRRYRP